MRVRYAQQDDWKRLQRLFDTFYFYRLNALTETIGKKKIIVAVKDEKIVGLLNINAKYDAILMLIVDKEYRKQGIARKLFKHAQVVYNLKKINISATVESISFWEKIGFKKTGVIKKTKNRELTHMIYT